MRVSKKTDYALRVLLFLAAQEGVGPVAIHDLAERNGIPKRFLEQILLKLKAQGWVSSRQGKLGGYYLAKSPDVITVGEVVRHFEGVLAPIGCVSVTAHTPCTRETTCLLRRVFLEIRDHTAHLLDQMTLANVVAGKPVVGEGAQAVQAR
jgi:Rrf2 family protein